MEGTYEGMIHISDQVIAKIARKVVLETKPIVSMPKGIVENFVKRMRGVHAQQGVMVDANQQEVALNLTINVTYGCKIHEVCYELQRSVTKEVEHMTGLMVKEIHVTVEGLVLS
ncbi:Asp23/Gls24 family envelope stress response protein [Paenibacillus algorifonticola]|uniref:Asp23/Gls24 family envelope stress response protein n=1 Tax=Paenibacillus algorifonticola TaxID=684063 RepID=UPI003D2BDFD9